MNKYKPMKSKIISELKNGLGVPRTRGEVAAQEQLRAFRQVIATKGEPREPTTRGEVAAQEQMRIFGQVIATKGEPREPTTRGEVAAQEQKRIVQLNAIQAFPTRREMDAIQAFPTRREMDAIQAFPTRREMDAIQAFNSSGSTGTNNDTKTRGVVAN
jgi:hypothetical protein